MNADAFADEVHELRFYIKRCIRYHMHRETWFSKINKTSSFLGVVFGSTAIGGLLNDSTLLTAASAVIVTVFSALDLVFSTGARASQHADLRKKYAELDLVLSQPGVDAAVLRNIRAGIARIEVEEPPTLWFLNEMASNEVIRSMYSPDDEGYKLADLPWHKRVTANLIDWDVGDHIPA